MTGSWDDALDKQDLRRDRVAEIRADLIKRRNRTLTALSTPYPLGKGEKLRLQRRLEGLKKELENLPIVGGD